MTQPPAGPRLNPDQLLEILLDHGVDFVVVGGVAANLHGTTRHTADCDIVVDQDAYNLRRLVDAFSSLRARARTDTPSIDEHNAAHLSEPAHPGEFQDAFLNVQTDAGPLDVLPHLLVGEADVLTYQDLDRHASYVDLIAGDDQLVIKIASIEHLIQAKEHIDRPHDRSDVAELKALQAKNI